METRERIGQWVVWGFYVAKWTVITLFVLAMIVTVLLGSTEWMPGE